MTNSIRSFSNNRDSCKGGVPFFAGFSRWFVHNRLRKLASDRLIICEGKRSWEYGDSELKADNTARISVHDARCYNDVAFGGTIGAGEAYMKGYWTTDDLTSVVRILLKNRKLLNNMETGLSRFSEPANKLVHWFNRNSKSGSRKNIAAHYDLGNEFFHLWLDESLMYSSAVFDDPKMSLEEASLAKMRRVCEKLELTDSDELLEIGTGWGGLAIYAAKEYGCRVTTTTISEKQYEFSVRRVKEAGLEDQVTVLKKDYRDLTGQFDKLVSIEMLEAIGHEFIDTYFQKCSSLLKSNGMMLLQTITIAHSEYERAKKSVDFIQRYIFPGGSLSSVQVLTSSVTRVSNLLLHHLEEIGLDYATTISHWRHRMFLKLADIKSLGYSDEFIRMWEFYFCYCEGGFIERAIGDVQLLLVKPDSQPSINFGIASSV
ncbi:MAG: SAM-dependent methyltransferase [Rhodospirillaceae bacterium]|nr:SAM-dependent methyltransferase [Rhodospirillaceae bacterium]